MFKLYRITCLNIAYFTKSQKKYQTNITFFSRALEQIISIECLDSNLQSFKFDEKLIKY